MNSSVSRIFPVVVAGFSLIALSDESARAVEIQVGVHKFTLPDGFEIEQVTDSTLVNRPISADFDEQGRLYVTDSSGSNDKVDIQLKERPHRIVRLEDTDGDGRFDKSVVFADKLMFPEGGLWYKGSLYVAAPPEIWKFTDTDDDGAADKREVWFDAKTLTGCANDLHGPYLGPDGWIYWCKGAFAEQTYERPGKSPFVTRAAHIFRRRPEGGPVEPVMTGGMDNPVDVVFTPGGERLFTTTFLQNPAGGLRDGLIHAIYGGVYGKIHGVLDGHARTGPVMPVLAHYGAAAPCGLVRLETDQLGPDYRDNVLACLFNMHKIMRNQLTPSGATFEAKQEDFLVSDNVDFHPTDILEDADGSLLVVNTGGWYKLCCPTSQLAKPDELGAIYRVKRSGAKPVLDARGKKLDWTALTDAQLADLLADARFTVRNRARQLLGERGVAAVATLAGLLKSSNSAVRLQSVGTLTQVDDPKAREAVRTALADKDEVVRQAALHSISVRRDAGAEPELIEMLESPSAQNQRAAAEALGRVGTEKAVSAILEAVADPADRVLDHSLIYALIEIGDAKRVRLEGMMKEGLAEKNPRMWHRALVALDQMPGKNLNVGDVSFLLDSPDAVLKETAWWIAEHHPEWGNDLADYFRKAIASVRDESTALATLSSKLASFSSNATIQSVMAEALADRSQSRAAHLAVLNAMIASRPKPMPESWGTALQGVLERNEADLLDVVVDAISVLTEAKPGEQFASRLQGVVDDAAISPAVRLKAFVSLPAGERRMDDARLKFLCEQLHVNQPVQVRALAVDVLIGSPLTDSQMLAVADAVAVTGPMELKRLLELFSKSHDAAVGAKFVSALMQCPVATSLTPDEVKQTLAAYGDDVAKSAQPLLDRIVQENRDKYDRLESILKLVQSADIRRGHQVFRGSKSACSTCHAMGYLGGRVGPDLSKIGKIRTERDILESLLFPSASFVRSYEPTTIVTAAGLIHNGIVRDENATMITLQLDALKSVQIPVSDVEIRKPGTVSVMPTGLEKQLSQQDMADLVLFLKAAQ